MRHRLLRVVDQLLAFIWLLLVLPTHLVVAARQHRVEGVFGTGVQLAGLGQVGVALEVHDRLDGAVVHVAGDRAVVVVELAQLLLRSLIVAEGCTGGAGGFGL